MAFSVVVLPGAYTDETTLYIEEQSYPERAARWRNRAFDAIESLAEMPRRFAIAPESAELGFEVRQLHYHSHRVLFFVDEEQAKVVVARVYHGARDRLNVDDLFPDA